MFIYFNQRNNQSIGFVARTGTTDGIIIIHTENVQDYLALTGGTINGSFMKEEVQDIALEVIQDSVKEYRIGGADYQAAEVVSYDFDPDGEMF